jgi:penicillin V acylase-like amidase (Ntn superfamily)
VAHVLFFRSADYGPRDASKPGLQATLQAQYALDNAATVSEALALLQKVQLVMAEVQRNGQTLHATLHLALEDTTGDSAIVEVVGGKQVVYHGRQYRVMTNDPPYDQQLELLKAYDFSHPTSDTPVPGNVNPRDRFARATYFLAVLATPKTERDGVAGMFSIARNVSFPFGAPVGSATYDTEYRTVSDATNRRYFFELTTAPNVIWAELKKFNLNAGASVMTLHPNNINLSGDVTGKFEAAGAPY